MKKEIAVSALNYAIGNIRTSYNPYNQGFLRGVLFMLRMASISVSSVQGTNQGTNQGTFDNPMILSFEDGYLSISGEFPDLFIEEI